MQKDLTRGSVLKNIICYSLPYLLSYFLQTLYGMADLFIIGQYEGVASTTAVSVGSQVMHVLTVILVGITMGSTVSIGQAVGAKEKEKAADCIGNTITLFAGIALVLTAALVLCARPIARMMSTPEAALTGTVQYLTICFLGIPFITAYNIISAVFRGMGDSRRPMHFVAVACAANIALDYLFMGALHMGPAGAALGTTLAQMISVLTALAALRRHPTEIPLTAGNLRPKRAVLTQILRIGLPIAAQDGFVQVSFILITILANQRGLTDAAAVGIVEKIISFLFLIPSSMLSAVSAIGAQNIGAGKPERARKTLGYAIAIACGVGLVIVIWIQFTAQGVVSLFTKDQAVAAAGGDYLRSYIWDSFFAGVQFSFSGYFCACGKSGLSFLHNFLSITLVRIPGAFFACRHFPDTLFPMGLASAGGSLLSIIICVIAYTVLRRTENMKCKEIENGFA